MDSFDFDVSEIELAGADGIDKINRFVIAHLVKRIASDKLTKAELAKRLNMDRSAVSRLLRGNQNLTARTLGEMMWAMGYEWDLVSRDAQTAAANARLQIAVASGAATRGPNPVNAVPKVASATRSDSAHFQRFAATAR